MNTKKDIYGCKKPFKLWNGKIITTTNEKCDFICGVPNAWGELRFCNKCKEIENYLNDKNLQRRYKNG